MPWSFSDSRVAWRPPSSSTMNEKSTTACCGKGLKTL